MSSVYPWSLLLAHVPLLRQPGALSRWRQHLLSLSFPWLFAIWNHVNRLFYGGMKKNRVETKKENRKKGGEELLGEKPVINQPRCLGLSASTPKSTHLMKAFGCKWFDRCYSFPLQSRQPKEMKIASTVGSFRLAARWGSRSPLIRGSKQRRTRTKRRGESSSITSPKSPWLTEFQQNKAKEEAEEESSNSLSPYARSLFWCCAISIIDRACPFCFFLYIRDEANSRVHK